MCSTGLGLFTQGTGKENKVKVNTTQARHAQHSRHPFQSGILSWESSAMEGCPESWERAAQSTTRLGQRSTQLQSWTELPGDFPRGNPTIQSPPRCSSTATGPDVRAAGLGAQPGPLSRAAAAPSSSKLRRQQWQYYGIIYTLTGLFTSLFKSF